MTQPPHMIAVAKFVRDLLVYDEQLIKFDRTDIPEGDFSTSYIVVNGSNIANRTSSGRNYDGELEIMNYNSSFVQGIILEFYGDDAYVNSSKFELINPSQLGADLKRALGLSISYVSSSTDVKQILGNSHGNRVHLEMNINYNPSFDVATLRVDSTEFTIIEDK